MSGVVRTGWLHALQDGRRYRVQNWLTVNTGLRVFIPAPAWTDGAFHSSFSWVKCSNDKENKLSILFSIIYIKSTRGG